MKNENPGYPEPYRNVVVGGWPYVVRCSYSNTGCNTMTGYTKDVLVTVRLTVAGDINTQELVNELGYQFTYVDDEYNELIVDSELIHLEEYE